MNNAEIDQHSLAVRLCVAVVARTGLLLALCFVSPLVFAQSCAPDAPRADSGEGFTPFGEHEQALARAGNARHAWEWALGPDTESRHKVRGNLDWVSGRVYRWTLVNNGTGREVLKIRLPVADECGQCAGASGEREPEHRSAYDVRGNAD
jgi:hypothetical protein